MSYLCNRGGAELLLKKKSMPYSMMGGEYLAGIKQRDGYIDLGFIPRTTNRIEIDFSFLGIVNQRFYDTKTEPRNSCFLLATGSEGHQANYFYCRSGGYPYLRPSTKDEYSHIIQNGRHNIKSGCSFSPTRNVWITALVIDDVWDGGSDGIQGNDASSNLCLSYNSDTQSVLSDTTNAIFYGMKVYDYYNSPILGQQQLLHDFKPCRLNGIVGMIDDVSGIFHAPVIGTYEAV